MILDKKSYDDLDKRIFEWETAGKVQGGITQEVGVIQKELVRLIRMADGANLDEITALLVYFFRTINDGQESVRELCDNLYGNYACDCEECVGPGPGETGLINEDGSYVTYEELGLEE
jgi:hypothetical protein